MDRSSSVSGRDGQETHDGEQQLPPHSQPAEQSVLGSLLRDNRVIDDLAALLRAEDFYQDAHQKIYQASLDLWHKAKAVDLVTLADLLHKRKQIADIGGHAYLAVLWDAAPTACNALHYAEIVRDRALARSLIYLAQDVLKEANQPLGPADELAADLERRVFALCSRDCGREPEALAMTVPEALDRIDRRTRGAGPGGLSVGLTDLDDLLSGLQNKELVILAARPSVGKSSLAAAIARHAAIAQDAPVLFFSLEQSKQELTERLLCSQAQVDSHKVRRGTMNADEISRLIEASSVLQQTKIFLDDTPSLSAVQVASTARRMARKHQIRLVIVDYIQLLSPESYRRVQRGDEEIGGIMKRLKALARELDAPVLALSQLNRATEQQERPRLRNLRGSGDIEQDADVVILLHRGADWPETTSPVVETIEAIVDKNRNGRVGTAKLGFRRATYSFENLAHEEKTPFI